MSFQSLRVRGFQRHADLTIEFDPKVTAIVGRSGSGKSAILRALRWIATNRPGGDAFVRWGSKRCVAELTVDGRTLKRKRRSGTNTYHLDGKAFKAIGSGVPSEVADLLNLDAINWQGQFDAPFWFGRSAGEVSRELNAIVNLGLIDRTLAGVAASLRKAKATAEVVADRLRDAKAAADGLAWAEEADADLRAVEELGERLEEKRLKRARIADQVEKASLAARRSLNAAQANGEAAEAVRAGASWAEAAEQTGRLRELLADLGRLAGEASDASAGAARVCGEIEELTGGVCPVCGSAMDLRKSKRA